jgi:hypothetical protein
VAAAVEENVHEAVVVANHDPGVLANCPQDVVSRIGDLGFVGDAHPAAGKDALELQLIELGIVVDPEWDEALFEGPIHVVQEIAQTRTEPRVCNSGFDAHECS